MRMPSLLLGFVCVGSYGCATGFDRIALQERLKLDVVEADSGSESSMNRVPAALRFPSKIAVYLQPNSHGNWNWNAQDKTTLESLAVKLKAEGIASDLIVIPEMLVGKGSMKELQSAALRCGADALFLVHGASQTDSYLNPAAVLNITGVGGYLVPGSHRDALFVIEACLIDPKSGFVYAGIQAEGEGRIIRPTFIIEEKDAINKAKTQALDKFVPELTKRMRNLAIEQKSAANTSPVAVSTPLPTYTPSPLLRNSP